MSWTLTPQFKRQVSGLMIWRALLLVGFAGGGLLVRMDAAGQENEATTRLANFDDKLQQFEATMARYYRGDPVERARLTVRQLGDDYNGWVETNHTRLATVQAKLKDRAEVIHQLETQIRGSDERLKDQHPDPSDRKAVEAYNAMVTERNALVSQHEQLAEAFLPDQTSFEAAVNRFQQEQTTRRQRVETAQRDAEQQVQAYRDWFESKNDHAFLSSLNQFYAQLHQEQRRPGRDPHLGRYLDRVRALRRELGERFARQQEKDRAGLLVVKATLCRTEECYLAVDTGANVVTISPALVETLGLTDRLGKEIEANVAGGGRIKGQELIIPQLSVLGHEVQDVEAVVLDESATGLDGLLGQSFLSRFSYRIEKGNRSKLVLEPRKKP